MSQARSYKDLLVWQRGVKLAVVIYRQTENFPRSELYGLVSQIQRAAVSIPSNIAEGQARKNPREFRHFLRIALGSAAELETQLIISKDLGYLSEDELNEITRELVEIQKMLFGLFNSLT